MEIIWREQEKDDDNMTEYSMIHIVYTKCSSVSVSTHTTVQHFFRCVILVRKKTCAILNLEVDRSRTEPDDNFHTPMTPLRRTEETTERLDVVIEIMKILLLRGRRSITWFFFD